MNWISFLNKACLENNIENVKLALDHVDINCGLIGACKGGHKDLALLMIEKGANDWNYGLDVRVKEGIKTLHY